MTDQQISDRGQMAAQVLENEAYQEAMRFIEAQIIEQWKECPIRDKEGQQILLQLIKLSDMFKNSLNGMISNGKIAQNKINVDNARSENLPQKMLRRAGF